MKHLLHSTLLFLCALSLLTCGCKKAEPPVADTSSALQQAFESADPALKERVTAVADGVKARKLVEATKALDQVVSSAKLTDAQAQAISSTILEMNEVAANNPQVDSKEMYDLRSKMFQSLRRRGP